MKLTVIVAETGAACNVGGPVTYRRVTVPLTEEQASALRLHDRWDSHGTTFIELDPEDKVCRCDAATQRYPDSIGRCGRCGYEIPASPGAAPSSQAPDPADGGGA